MNPSFWLSRPMQHYERGTANRASFWLYLSLLTSMLRVRAFERRELHKWFHLHAPLPPNSEIGKY